VVRLEGWSRQRRVIVLRRCVKGALAASSIDDHGQQKLSFAEVVPSGIWLGVFLLAQLEQIGQAPLFRFAHDRLIAEARVAAQ
jgi:hypothetical protein